MAHVIGKQILNVDIQIEESPYAVQQALSDLYWQSILPAVGSLFDQWAGADEVIQLDQLEIDIGTIDLEAMSAEEIADLVVERLDESMQDLVKHKSKGQVRQPTSVHYFDQWILWLEKGYLPGVGRLPANVWQKNILETLGLKAQKALELQIFLHQHPIALERLVRQHTPAFLKSLTELYSGFDQQQLLSFFDELKVILTKSKTLKGAPAYRKIETTFWKTILTKTLIERKKINTKDLCVQLPKEPGLKAIFTAIANALAIKKGDSGKLQVEPKRLKEFPQIAEILIENQIEPEPQLLKLESLEDMEVPGLGTINEPLFFANAGVVLVNPFLTTLFKKLDLLEGNSFKDLYHKSKAVVVLHFLATGQTDTQDFNLVLPKLLCGIPFSQPLDHTIALSDEEQTTVIGLLEAVIQNWGVLGDVSPDSLREGFLVREGKLENTQSGWKLFVEQKTIDVLLDRLPWNLSIIKLPWMQEMLHVEWR